MSAQRKIVWLASYPKSGNTWVRLLLGNLLGLSEEDEDAAVLAPTPGISSNRALFEEYLGQDTCELTDVEIDRVRPAVYRLMAQRSDRSIFVKAHDCYGRIPGGEPIFPADCSIGAVHIVRDPLDVAVSFAHHRGDHGYEETVEAMCNDGYFVSGGSREQLRQMLLDWSGHYRSWTKQAEMPVCLVRYEDLRADTPGELRRIAQFAELDESTFACSIEAAVEASRFDRLQQIEAEKGFAERPLDAQQFFRSGRSGEGREKLPASLQSRLIARHADVMRELGYL